MPRVGALIFGRPSLLVKPTTKPGVEMFCDQRVLDTAPWIANTHRLLDLCNPSLGDKAAVHVK